MPRDHLRARYKGELRRDLARALRKGRATRYTILLSLPDGHDAEHVQQAIIAKMKTLPKPLLSTLTWDQGSELAWHRDITASLDMQVYFCDPHSP
ncbi:transposase [Bifidobacterium pseudolongum subsp. globosum]|nr:transposase [Bifidobacterium pseudolongum subsp. globosum]